MGLLSSPSAGLALACALSSNRGANAAPRPSGRASQDENRVSQFTFVGIDDATMQTIALRYSIEARRGDTFTVYVPAVEAAAFLTLAPQARLVTADVDAESYPRGPNDRAGYPSYDEIRATFADYQIENPDLALVPDLPWMVSQDGLPIVVLKLSGDVAEDNFAKPAIVITASTHGDEWITTPVVMGLIERLVMGYGSEARITKMLDWSSVYFVPAVSPDSFQSSRNVHGVDPNRVYPYPGNDAEPSIASARNMIRFYDMLKPAGSLDYHANIGMVLYPWGWSCNPLD
ncbi:MAG: M14 family metallopeptidase [Nannocystaceae bacterium]